MEQSEKESKLRNLGYAILSLAVLTAGGVPGAAWLVDWAVRRGIIKP